MKKATGWDRCDALAAAMKLPPMTREEFLLELAKIPIGSRFEAVGFGEEYDVVWEAKE